MTPEQIQLLLNGGIGAVSLFMLWQVWNRLNVIVDRLFVYLDEARVDRQMMMQVIQKSNEQKTDLR